MISIVLLLFVSLRSSPSPSSAPFPHSSSVSRHSSLSLVASSPSSPSLAYLLSGSDSGDVDRLLRLLRAVYHPRNTYLLALDLPASPDDRRRLAIAVRAVPVFLAVGNVHVVGRPGFSDLRGSSALAATLHGAAVLLRIDRHWDWFVNLRASDYPLVTQDDLLHVFSFLPRDLNFMQHSRNFSKTDSRRVSPIVVDPGLYLSSASDVFYATQKREVPNAYKLFTGSSSFILSRNFLEFCILGTDNLPRTLLMYYANTPSPQTDYFQTVMCNSLEFNGTIVNANLRFVAKGSETDQEPGAPASGDLKNFTESGAVFGSGFSADEPILNRIDEEVLDRGSNGITRGGWCLGKGEGDPCDVWGHSDVLMPGPGAMKLASAISSLSDPSYQSQQCI